MSAKTKSTIFALAGIVIAMTIGLAIYSTGMLPERSGWVGRWLWQ